jgi:hypothetical protein
MPLILIHHYRIIQWYLSNLTGLFLAKAPNCEHHIHLEGTWGGASRRRYRCQWRLPYWPPYNFFRRYFADKQHCTLGTLYVSLFYTLAKKNNIVLPDEPCFASASALNDRYQNFSGLDDYLHYNVNQYISSHPQRRFRSYPLVIFSACKSQWRGPCGHILLPIGSCISWCQCWDSHWRVLCGAETRQRVGCDKLTCSLSTEASATGGRVYYLYILSRWP